MTDSQKKAIEELDSIMLKIGSAYCEDDKYEVTAQTLVELSFMVTHNKTLLKHSRNITLRQLLAYFNNQDPSDADQIQIVFKENEWADYDQVSVTSKLLIPYYDYRIQCLGVEDIACDCDNGSVIRVSLDEEITIETEDDD